MITRTGWLVAIGSIACLIVARLLGSLELFLLGVIGLFVMVLALALVWTRRVRLEVSRRIIPARVHAGTQSRVDLSIVNRGTRRTPVLRLRDAVAGTRGANLLVGPLDPGAGARASYRLPTERRGIVEIGPMNLIVTDPFGLAQSTITGAGVARLTVYPPMHRLGSLPTTGGSDPTSGFERNRTLNRSGDEFYALRPFSVGDELRRVHWPSSARHDELLVRQEELPWQGRITVALDNTRSRMPDDALDLGATIAASIVHAAHQKGNQVRIVTADGSDSGFTTGNAQLESLLELLAVVEPRTDASLQHALDTAATQLRHGVVVVTGDLDNAGLAAVNKLSRSFAAVTAVLIDRSAWDPKAPEGPQALTRRLVRITRSAPFPEAWHRAMASSARPVGAPR
jgi:uncharacterized protein (DUF58 family)